MKRKTKGKTSDVTLKIDHAYDGVEWAYIHGVIQMMDFDPKRSY